MKHLLILFLGLLFYSNIFTQNVFSVDYENQADLKIYFVDYSNLAGWNKKKNKHLLY